MQHPDEGTIHTWLDGELSAEDAAELEAHVADCAQCAAAVAEARGLIAGSSRIVSSLDSVPAGVIPERRPGSRAWYSTTQFRAAAALLLVAGTSLLLVRRNETSASRMMAVSAPRAKATDAASSPVAAAASAPAETAGTIPAVKPPPVVKAPSSSNAPVSGSAAVAAKAAPTASESRAEAAPLNRAVTFGMAGASRQSALKSALPQPVVQDSGTSVATADEGAAAGLTLRLIRTDSLRSGTQRVFETPNGIQLMMTESNRVAFSPPAAQSAPMAPAVRKAAAAIPPKDQVKLSDYRTITWTDATTGRSYSLTGPLPPNQLEKFKALVIKLSK